MWKRANICNNTRNDSRHLHMLVLLSHFLRSIFFWSKKLSFFLTRVSRRRKKDLIISWAESIDDAHEGHSAAKRMFFHVFCHFRTAEDVTLFPNLFLGLESILKTSWRLHRILGLYASLWRFEHDMRMTQVGKEEIRKCKEESLVMQVLV